MSQDLKIQTAVHEKTLEKIESDLEEIKDILREIREVEKKVDKHEVYFKGFFWLGSTLISAIVAIIVKVFVV